MAESLAAFGVKNLRCLTDTGLIPIKPLTLLVGRNSSGKSTFLRAFPLLRQSVQNPRRSPILWNHPSYVDFGSLDTAVNARARDQGVTFCFAADLREGFFREPTRCELSMTIAGGESGAYLHSYDLVLEGRTVRMVFDPGRRMKSLEIDGREPLLARDLWLAGAASLLPWIDPTEESRLSYVPFAGRFIEPAEQAAALTKELLAPLMSQYALSSHDAFDVARVFAVPGGDLVSMARRLHGALVEKGIDPVIVDPKSEGFRALADAAILIKLPAILMAFDSVVADFASGVAYLGPRRAVGERQYLQSEIAIEEIFPRGENLPQFLAALHNEEMADLAEFTRDYLGFEPALRQQGRNIEILIKQSGASEYQNIADVGFGYAEVLPLCASIWLNMFETSREHHTSMLVLEQPELHLHPAHQARLARLLAGALKDSRKQGYRASLMVETHSEALVNGLGLLVREKQISAEDIQIVFFDQDRETRETTIRLAGYKDNGALRDWPFGFLAPVADRLEDLADAAAGE